MSKYFLNPQLYAEKGEDGKFEFDILPPKLLCKTQLEEKFPKKTSEEISKLLDSQTNEFTSTTPSVLSWQDFNWPVDDGDYCQFVMTAGKKDLNDLSGNGDGFSFFQEHMDNDFEVDTLKSLWRALKPGKMVSNGVVDERWPAMSLVFKSQFSNEYFIIFDSL